VLSIDIRKAALMNTTRLRLSTAAMILSAVGLAAGLAGCASTAGIAPAGDSTLDDVLQRGLIAYPGSVVLRPDDRPERELPDRLVVASAR
jgi:hypothetical protein